MKYKNLVVILFSAMVFLTYCSNSTTVENTKVPVLKKIEKDKTKLPPLEVKQNKTTKLSNGVLYVDNSSMMPVFYHDKVYWRYHRGEWYYSSTANAPWNGVANSKVNKKLTEAVKIYRKEIRKM